ncbi:MAG: hypothetical protein JNL67_07700 [Planctomycetaceae bacterium]|nr:hypothetical protein [Planctomycetaceae bacterium]
MKNLPIVWLSFLAILTTCLLRLPEVLGQDDRKGGSASQDVEANASNTSTNEEIVSVECSGRIERFLDEEGREAFIVDVKAPILEGSRKYKLSIAIVNPFDEPIEYSEVSLTCGCAKFEVDGKEIPALGTANFVMHLDVPNHVGMPLGRVTANFLGAGGRAKPVLRLAVTYQLHGVFGFHSDREIVEIPKNEPIATIKLPVIVVEPMTLDRLELKFSDNLRDCQIEVVSDDPDVATPYVKIQVPKRLVPRHGMAAEVGFIVKGTKHVAGVIVSIKHQETFSIRPESLRLSRDNHSKPYHANAMLRVSLPTTSIEDPESKLKGGEEKLNEVPGVALTIGGRPARVSVQPMGRNGLFRLMMQHDGPFQPNSDGTVEVRWKVEFRGEVYEVESHGFISEK